MRGMQTVMRGLSTSDPTVNLCVKVLECGGYGGGVVCGHATR